MLYKEQKVVTFLLHLQNLGSWLSRGVGEKEMFPFYFYMFEICVSWQISNLMSSVAGCRDSGRIELNQAGVYKVSQEEKSTQSMFMHRDRAGVDVVAVSCSGSVFDHLLKIQGKERVQA